MISKSVVAVVSSMCGVCVTLLIFSVARLQDPKLVAAEQRFRELPTADARRIQATFDRLQLSPDDRMHVESMHVAVEDDAALQKTLNQVHKWWVSCTADQRADLREFRATPHRWVDEVERQMGAFEKDTVSIILPSPPERGRGSGRRQTTVTWEQVDRFLDAALPDDELTDSDRRLLDEVQDADYRLAQVLVTLRSLFDFGSERLQPDHRQVQRVFRAAASTILPGDASDRGGNERQDAIVCFSILKSLNDHLAQDFAKHHLVADDDVEQLFERMKPSDRIPQMLSEPREIVGELSATLNAQQRGTPEGQLARQLEHLNRVSTRLRQLYRIRTGRGERPGQGPGRGFRLEDRDRREFREGRGPGGRRSGGPP